MRAASHPLAALGVGALLSGCALPIQGEIDQMAGIARYATSYDHVVGAEANLIDRALAGCSEKTVEAETACVRTGIDAARPKVSALMALVPGCRAGQVCHYDHTTRDRLGFVQASATEFVREWRVDLDFRRPAAEASQVPILVIDREDFGGAPG